MLLSSGLITAPWGLPISGSILQAVQDALLQERLDQAQHPSVRHLLTTSAIRRSCGIVSK